MVGLLLAKYSLVKSALATVRDQYLALLVEEKLSFRVSPLFELVRQHRYFVDPRQKYLFSLFLPPLF